MSFTAQQLADLHKAGMAIRTLSAPNTASVHVVTSQHGSKNKHQYYVGLLQAPPVSPNHGLLTNQVLLDQHQANALRLILAGYAEHGVGSDDFQDLLSNESIEMERMRDSLRMQRNVSLLLGALLLINFFVRFVELLLKSVK